MTTLLDQTLGAGKDYMNEDQLDYFKNKLQVWRDELVRVSKGIMVELKEQGLREPDPVDYSALHAEKERGILTKVRNSLLIEQIEYALCRIEKGDFGYCEMTGEEIGLRRLMALPIATLSVGAQEMIERQQRMAA